MSDQLSQYQQEPQRDDEITLKDIIRIISGLLGSWPILMAGMIIGVGIAFLVNRYTSDKFEISATVAVEETDNPLASAEGMLNLGFSFDGTGIVDTRTAVLKSYAHNARVARSLGWGVKYFNEGRLNRREIYNPEHFSVEFDDTHDQLLGAEFSIDFSEDDFELEFKNLEDKLFAYNFLEAEINKKAEVEEFEELTANVFEYGEWIESSLYRFRILKGEDLPRFLEEQQQTTSAFQFLSYDDIANWAMETIETESNDKQQSSLLTMRLKGPLKEQMADFLNMSIEELQAYELRQNLMAINTIQFIDGQLIQIESSLRDSEAALEEFRSNNLIVDLSSESEQMLEYFIELEQERAALNLQRSFYRYVIDFLQNKQNYSGLSLPTLSTFNDPLVAQLTEQLVESSVALERYRYSLEV